MSLTLEELMDTRVDDLAKRQHDALKQHTLAILDKATKAIMREDYNAAIGMLFVSPAGDGYGLDNQCINFSFKSGDHITDFGEIVITLTALKKASS